MTDPEEEVMALASAEIDKAFKSYLRRNPDNLENATNALVDDLIDDAIMSCVFEVDQHRKLPVTALIAPNQELVPSLAFIPGIDIFGNVSKSFEICSCPHCNKSVATSRFAPHLVKCMGMQSTNTRSTRTRNATNANKDSGGTSSCTVTDDEDDADWSAIVDKKGKKKKEKLNGKKIKHKVKTSASGGSAESRESSSPGISYDLLSERDRRALLSQICGVISEHTKKVCTKTTRCPLHTDEQKKALRELYLTEASEAPPMENIHIDVDTCEEEGEITKDSLSRNWEAENSNTSSPYDSTSTSSTSSKKRDKSSNKSGKSKKEKSMQCFEQYLNF